MAERGRLKPIRAPETILFPWNKSSRLCIRNPLRNRVKSFRVKVENLNTHARGEALLR
jgi:hypothetical protein